MPQLASTTKGQAPDVIEAIHVCGVDRESLLGRPENDPMRRLFCESEKHCRSAEGLDAIRAALHYAQNRPPLVASLDGDTVSPLEHTLRLRAVLNLADEIISEIPGVSVVLYGSALRGRKNFSDVDLRVVTKYEPPLGDFMYSAENGIQTEIHHKLQRFDAKMIEGRRVDFHVDSSFDEDLARKDLILLPNGPFLAILPGRELKPQLFGPPQVFFSPGDGTFVRNKIMLAPKA